jgi:hypothetical protein
MLQNTLIEITTNKIGVEIGGPSQTGNVIYHYSTKMDNVIFSKNTIWNKSTDIYQYYPNKSGNVIINDAVNISNVKVGE